MTDQNLVDVLDECIPIKTYKPQEKIADILNWSLQKIKSVPYDVSLRWIFYRAVQEKGLLKTDYKNFKEWTRKPRKRFWNGWAPNTLIDDTREITERGGGYDSPQDWLEHFKRESCTIDKRRTQPRIVILCFEAQAMYSQFHYYSSDYYVSLVPFKGDATIEPKWRLAKWIEQLDVEYGKPVKILYFGDLDEKGKEIPENAMKDVRKWCNIHFDYERVGLNEEHVQRWGLPENPEKPGYQWEALDDAAAKELIQNALNANVDLEAIEKVVSIEDGATERWRQIAPKFSKLFKEDGEL